MSRYAIEAETLTAIADAIRAKRGTDTSYTPLEMPAAIQAIDDGVFAFVTVKCFPGDTVTATNGTITLIGDTSGTYVFALPDAGPWTFSDGLESVIETVLNYGESRTTNLRSIEIIQDYTNDGDATYIFSNHGKALTVTWTVGTENINGFVINTNGRNVSYSRSGPGTTQVGTSKTAGSMPSLVASGANRGMYTGLNPGSLTWNIAYPYFFFSVYGAARGSQITFTVTL